MLYFHLLCVDILHCQKLQSLDCAFFLIDCIEYDASLTNEGVIHYERLASAFLLMERLKTRSDDVMPEHHTSFGCVDIEVVKLRPTSCSGPQNLQETKLFEMPICMLHEVKSARGGKHSRHNKVTWN